jgi:hypothetical protein
MSDHNYVNGFGGSVEFDSDEYDVTKWSIKISATAEDTTNTGDEGWESNILGTKSFDGSFDMPLEPSQIMAIEVGDRATATFNVGNGQDGEYDSTGSYAGTIQITSIGPANPAKGACTISYDFKGSGPLTYTS